MHRFHGVFWLLPHWIGVGTFRGRDCLRVCVHLNWTGLQQQGYEWENRKEFYGQSHSCHWNHRRTERANMGTQRAEAHWESPIKQIPSLRARLRMVAHQCDINGNQQSHLCAHIWYLINKNKMRLSFTLKERNLTSSHKHPIDNWAGLHHRSSLGTVWKGWSASERIGCPDVLLVSRCIFHILKLANWATYHYIALSFNFIVVWVTRLSTNGITWIWLQEPKGRAWPLAEKQPNAKVISHASKFKIVLTGVLAFISSTQLK